MIQRQRLGLKEAKKKNESISEFIDTDGKFIHCDFVEFNKQLKKGFKVLSEIRRLLYDNSFDRFIYNAKTKKNVLNPLILEKTNEYTLTKKLIKDISDHKSGKLNLILL